MARKPNLRPPKFDIGESVAHLGRDRKPIKTRISAVFDSDGAGWRYYVFHSGFTWSVPETFIASTSEPKQSKSRASDSNNL